MKSASKVVAEYSAALERLRARGRALEQQAAGALYVRNRVEGALLRARAEAAAHRVLPPLRTHATASESEARAEICADLEREIDGLEAELSEARRIAAVAVETFRASRRQIAVVERERLQAVLLASPVTDARASRRGLEVDARLDALRAELEALSIARALDSGAR